jgi:hypothetical protein
MNTSSCQDQQNFWHRWSIVAKSGVHKVGQWHTIENILLISSIDRGPKVQIIGGEGGGSATVRKIPMKYIEKHIQNLAKEKVKERIKEKI